MKQLRKLFSIITTALTLIITAAAFLLVGVRIFGYEPFIVLSGSMTPSYQVGDLVYVRETDPEKIEPGMTITYVMDESSVIVTHRVVEADRVNRCFYTKGDANKDRDGRSVSYENVVGVVGFSIPYLGYVAEYLQSTPGRVNALALLVLAVIGFIATSIEPKWEKRKIPKKGRKKYENEKKQKKK